MHLMDPDLYSVLLVVAFVLAAVSVIQSRAFSLLAVACTVGFLALWWDAAAVAGWF